MRPVCRPAGLGRTVTDLAAHPPGSAHWAGWEADDLFRGGLLTRRQGEVVSLQELASAVHTAFTACYRRCHHRRRYESTGQRGGRGVLRGNLVRTGGREWCPTTPAPRSHAILRPATRKHPGSPATTDGYAAAVPDALVCLRVMPRYWDGERWHAFEVNDGRAPSHPQQALPASGASRPGGQAWPRPWMGQPRGNALQLRNRSWFSKFGACDLVGRRVFVRLRGFDTRALLR